MKEPLLNDLFSKQYGPLEPLFNETSFQRIPAYGHYAKLPFDQMPLRQTRISQILAPNDIGIGVAPIGAGGGPGPPPQFLFLFL